MINTNSNTLSGDPMSSAAVQVLLVEDNVDNQFLFNAFVKKLACKMDIAENGAVGVEKFKSGSYDLVIMDLQMPVMDGYTATQIIRQWEKENCRQQTPIVALTANAMQEMIEKCLARGCTAYITKPVSRDTFIGIITQYAERER